MMIRFNNPAPIGNEAAYVAQALAQGHLSGDGPFTKRSQEKLQDFLPGSHVLLTTSCTHALEMAALLVEAQPGDEVIMPPFTFVSTANAFVLRGMRPVFVDIRQDTLNIDESKIEAAITERTRAIAVVHYAGVGCEMDAITEIARRHNLTIIEDNAHGLFGAYRGRHLGTMGQTSTLSFHETKNVTCGEGGAIVVNDAAMLERAEILREKGTNRSRFFRGQVDKYSWVDVGSSYLPSDLLAAVLLAQLEKAGDIQRTRKRIWDSYAQRLANWAVENGVALPHIPDHCRQAYHMFYMLLPSLEDRTAFIRHMRERGIVTVFHYLPLNTSEMAQRLGLDSTPCPITGAVSDRLVRLPFYNTYSEADQERTVQAVLSFRCRSRISS